MRGRDEDGARLRRQTLAGLDVDALFVDRHGMNRDAGRHQRQSRQRVSGILDPSLSVGACKRANDDIDGVLRACCDDDLFRIAPDRARGPQVVADMIAKCGGAARIAIAEMLGAERAQRARRQFAP